MVNRKTRMTVPVPVALERLLDEILQEAASLQETDIQLSADKTAAAWALVPEPKFNTSCTLMVLNDHLLRLLDAGRIQEASNIAGLWVADIESSAEPVNELRPYVLFAASLLYLSKPSAAKTIIRMTRSYGARKSDFKGLPALYWDLFLNTQMEDAVLMKRFQQEILQPQRQLPETEAVELHPFIVDYMAPMIQLGHSAFAAGNYEKAARSWIRALKQIPEPKSEFAQSLTLNAAIGDAFFLLRDYQQALPYLEAAKANIAENGQANAFVLLRLGEVLLELEEHADARECLLRAYTLGGEKLFENEAQPYLDFLHSCLGVTQD
ncbi:hypothetical protein HF329_10700 [Chitinophaga oryzae]|uniref:Tetratricopeptide repeat protein n=1 Tax=Chitinophaga oryzae TaxID=2725414 RepID=A0AAE6ZFN6_9BACT|nr:hypothetical protein [Chitinophaga oryzae]QJB31761.1 hypothetical protein HF329_10700 [Chitinophaga oryzae]